MLARFEHDGTEFEVWLVCFEGDKLERLSLGDAGIAIRAKQAVEVGRFMIEEVEMRSLKRNPAPSFTTLTL